MRTAFFSPALPRIFAHRGLALGVGENTLEAFQAALTAGATHLETDVHASADGVPVLSHDPDLRRLTGDTRRVHELDWARLRERGLEAGHPFTTLDEALGAFPSARFNIDVKHLEAAESVATAVADADASERVLITSFSEAGRAAALARLPPVATSASSRRLRGVLTAYWRRSRRGVERALSGVDAVQVPVRYRMLPIVTASFVAAMHAAGVEVHVWTVNEPAEMARLLDLGVDGLVTDRCDLARGVADARS